ncbi:MULTISPECIES: hypothetical protein [unclassified Exiguobacterium]|uniref:hypothetical protein n=1 Tax=unclassified Exiguobacterium TaxID=2644629 RepID=UPI001BE6A864|nr:MULTISPECIES: hypothetical protein [unclassified Exiguobacterium]
MERTDIFRMIQSILSNPNGTLDRGVTFKWTSDGNIRVVGLVFDLLLDRYFLHNKTSLSTEVQEIAMSTGCRPEEVVRAFACLSGIRLESNHIVERFMVIEEAMISQSGEIGVTVRFGGWLTYQLQQICQHEKILSF